MRAGVVVLALLTGCASRPPEVPPPVPVPSPVVPRWLDVVEVGLGTSSDGLPRGLVLVRADPAAAHVRVVAASGGTETWRTAAQVAAETGAGAVINGGFFDERMKPLGLVISDGRQSNPLRKADWGVFVVRGGRPRILHTREVTSTEGIEQAVQCGPRLVVDGRPLGLKATGGTARSAVGVDSAGRIVLAATTGSGATLAELAAVLARPWSDRGGGCSAAMNLDGGPSTQLEVPGRISIPGAYPMPTHLALLSP